MSSLGEVCEHGSLKRQCLVCDLLSENEKMRAALRKIAECDATVCPESQGKYVAKAALADDIPECTDDELRRAVRYSERSAADGEGKQ